MKRWQWTLHSSPFLYHLHCHSQKCLWEEREGHFLESCVGILLTCLSLTSITEAGQKCLVSSYTRLFDKGPLWFSYQAPLHGYRIQGLWSRLWKFHCFLWLQQIAPKCYKCGGKKKGKMYNGVKTISSYFLEEKVEIDAFILFYTSGFFFSGRNLLKL